MATALVKDPIYQQLNQILRGLITSGEYPIGKKFLTEREVGDRYGISRVTANKALSSLVSEGLLEFRKGVGTYVRGRPLDYNLRALVSFTDEAVTAGKKPSTTVLEFTRQNSQEAPESVRKLLETAAPDELIYVARLRLADALPVILEKRYIVARHCPQLSASDLNLSLYAVWIENYHLQIEGADQTIRAVNINGADAKVLQVREGSAGLLATSLGYLAGRQPLWHESTLYRGDTYEFHNRLAGIERAGQPIGRFLERSTN